MCHQKKTHLYRSYRSIKGFTLIELMIVVSIIGILSTVAIPSYQEYVRKARLAEGYVLTSTMTKAQIANFNQWGYFGGMHAQRFDAAEMGSPASGAGYQSYIPYSGKFEITIYPFRSPDAASKYMGFLDDMIAPNTQSFFILNSQNGFFDSSGADSFMDAAVNGPVSKQARGTLFMFKGTVGPDHVEHGVYLRSPPPGVQGLPGEYYGFSSAHAMLVPGKVTSLFQMVRAYQGAISISPIVNLTLPYGIHTIGGS